jgi:hypothetical protein
MRNGFLTKAWITAALAFAAANAEVMRSRPKGEAVYVFATRPDSPQAICRSELLRLAQAALCLIPEVRMSLQIAAGTAAR